jgi:hypothetical protein
MKRVVILSLVLLLGSTAFGRSDWSDKLMQFNKSATEHKAAWFDLKKEYHVKMTDLLKRIHADWSDYRNQVIQDWKNVKDCSDASKDTIFADEYSKAVKLHKSHRDAWKNLCDEHTKKATALAQEQDQEMQNMDVISIMPVYKR